MGYCNTDTAHRRKIPIDEYKEKCVGCGNIVKKEIALRAHVYFVILKQPCTDRICGV